jgi:hypothetical protein
MGYSIGIRPRSKKLRDRMLGFMDANYRSWPALRGDQDGPCFAGAPTTDLDYDSGTKRPLGINYGPCSGWEREYAFLIVRWMALRVGTNRTTFSDGIRTKTPTPFMVYDGFETWPLLVGTTAQNARLPEKIQWCAVDRQGIHNGPDALADYARQAVFEVETDVATVTRICKCLGAMPLEGNRSNWRATFKEELAQTPALQAHIDEKLGLMRAELDRLDRLWKTFEDA